jgi:hypothetical protein
MMQLGDATTDRLATVAATEAEQLAAAQIKASTTALVSSLSSAGPLLLYIAAGAVILYALGFDAARISAMFGGRQPLISQNELLKFMKSKMNWFQGKDPSAADIKAWYGAMMFGYIPFQQYTDTLKSSPYTKTYLTNGITAGYNNLLGRAPDTSGFNFYYNQIIDEKMSLQQVISALAASDEAKAYALKKVQSATSAKTEQIKSVAQPIAIATAAAMALSQLI